MSNSRRSYFEEMRTREANADTKVCEHVWCYDLRGVASVASNRPLTWREVKDAAACLRLVYDRRVCTVWTTEMDFVSRQKCLVTRRGCSAVL